MSDMSLSNSADEEINDHYSYQKNLQMQKSKKPKTTMKVKPKKQKLIMVNTSDQNSEDEEIDFQSHLLKLEQEYDGITAMVNENCIRVKKSDGGNFCIKIPENKTASDYLVIQKYKTSDIKKVESKDRHDSYNQSILRIYNDIVDTNNIHTFMCNDDKKIESYK
ncbi:unnamed protein product [Macrosiphum euphorbiae]|uniref:Uncharacterized protein n=1 Tax=Macrosiphum euphorbiae TaxID=13131 RepID=A0AAV0WNJ4_9HEMI|nr:unnamed protein product [Macrosiphum euphorbiae]